MPAIKFSEQWDKLKPKNMSVGRTFTTARGYEPQKETYYLDMKGKEFDIVLSGKIIGRAMLKAVGCAWTYDVPISWWKEDMYYHVELKDVKEFMRKFYKNESPFLILLTLVWTSTEGEDEI